MINFQAVNSIKFETHDADNRIESDAKKMSKLKILGFYSKHWYFYVKIRIFNIS